MTKKRKIILISLAVTLALSVGVGGLVYAVTNGNNNHVYEHEDVGGNKLLGVGHLGNYDRGGGPLPESEEWWDTDFIITNPNCEKYLYIEWVALIDEDENVIAEGTPDHWNYYMDSKRQIPDELSPHEVWEPTVAALLGDLWGESRHWVMNHENLTKYTLEVTWSGARYTGWWWWGYWRSGRPLTGWQKEMCTYNMGCAGARHCGFTISEAEMKLFHSRQPFEPGEPYPPIEY